jgi:hypothetical protein
MHTCKVTIGSVFAVALLVLTSSCGGGGMANGGGGTGPAASSVYVSGVSLAGLASSIAEFPTTANGAVSPTSTIEAPANFFFQWSGRG